MPGSATAPRTAFVVARISFAENHSVRFVFFRAVNKLSDSKVFSACAGLYNTFASFGRMHDLVSMINMAGILHMLQLHRLPVYRRVVFLLHSVTLGRLQCVALLY